MGRTFRKQEKRDKPKKARSEEPKKSPTKHKIYFSDDDDDETNE